MINIILPEHVKDFCPNGRILGMDIGQKTLGLAVSNSSLTMALPHSTIKRTKFTQDIHKLIPIIREYEISDYVLGWPLNMDGSRGAGCERVQSFADEMSKNADIFGENAQILLWDERLSTASVGEMVDKRVDKMKKSGELDALAAQIILQGALDRLGRG